MSHAQNLLQVYTHLYQRCWISMVTEVVQARGLCLLANYTSTIAIHPLKIITYDSIPNFRVLKPNLSSICDPAKFYSYVDYKYPHIRFKCILPFFTSAWIEIQFWMQTIVPHQLHLTKKKKMLHELKKMKNKNLWILIYLMQKKMVIPKNSFRLQ